VIYFVLVSVFILVSFLIARFSLSEKSKDFSDWNFDEIIQFNHESIRCVMKIDGIISGKVESIVFFVNKIADEQFYFRNKTLLDQILIKLNLLKSYQSNNNEFNKQIFIASDNEKLYDEINKANIQSAMFNIFSLPYLYDCKSIKIENNEAFIIEFKLGKKYRKKDIDLSKFSEQYGNYFLEIYHGINTSVLDCSSQTMLRPIQNIKFISIFGSSLSFFLCMIEVYITYPSTVDLVTLIFTTIVLSALYSIGISFYIYKKINRSSFKLDLIRTYSLYIFISYFFFFMMVIKYLNVWNDNSSQLIVKDIITSKYSSSRSAKRYEFHLKNNRNQIDTYDVRVDSDVYNKKEIGDTATIYVKQGNFNIRWIEKVE
jgi:hypothetical protein